MSISDAQFTAWLSDPSAIKCTLIDLSVRSGGTETTRYVSSVPYVMSDASIMYLPILNGSVRFTEQLLLNGGGLSVSDLELINPNGEYDSWLNDVWVGRQVVARFGDVRWDKSDFRTIFNGIMFDISSRGRDTLNIQIRDKLQRLNTPVSDNKLGGSTSNKDSVIPITFGEVHNIAPLQTDPTILEFQVNDGPIEDIIEVRDNGVPIPVTKSISTGKFTLQAQLQGTLTCSVQGTKPSTYYNTIAQLIKLIVKNYGKTSDRFTDSDIDLTNFSSFDTANPQPVGYYMADRENVLSVCQALASSVGAQLVMSRLGLLQLLRINLPATSPTFSIYDYDIVQRSLQISNTSTVEASVKLGYCKNWTVEENLQTGIIQEHKDLFAKDWLTSTITDSTVQSIYKLSSEPEQVDTYLLKGTDATTEATRRLNIIKVPRTTYRFTGFSRLLELTLGQQITIYNNRYNMSSGVNAVVTSLTPNWVNGKIDVEIMV